MNYFYAFLVGGLICLVGQLLIELFKLTPGHITCIFVILGCFLEFGNIYDKLVKIGSAGALLPITSFGHSLAEAAYIGAKNDGFLGLIGNILKTTSPGIVGVVVLSVFIGLFFKPKG